MVRRAGSGDADGPLRAAVVVIEVAVRDVLGDVWAHRAVQLRGGTLQDVLAEGGEEVIVVEEVAETGVAREEGRVDDAL